jgi:hypothetical protein
MVAINVSERKRRAKPPSPLVLILNFQGFRYYLRAMRKSVLLLFLLAGCVDQQAARERVLSSQAQNCSDYGFKKGTDAFAQCMQTGINERRRAAVAFLASRPVANPVYLPPLQTSHPINCTSSAIGAQISTSCY